MGEHCASCICGRRAPVQRSEEHKRVAGTVSWAEHEEAWAAYAARYGRSQSAERMAERGGFCFGELVMFLGREPATWAPAGAVAERERDPAVPAKGPAR